MEIPRTFLNISLKFYGKCIFEHMKPLSMSTEREQQVAKRYPINSLYSITMPVWLFLLSMFDIFALFQTFPYCCFPVSKHEFVKKH